jgi:hypothetical protein
MEVLVSGMSGSSGMGGMLVDFPGDAAARAGIFPETGPIPITA